MLPLNDPIGLAIQDYLLTQKKENITVLSDLCEDDVFPVCHFFRTYSEMPELEQKALKLSHGKILDVGAGAGCHSAYLQNQNADVTAIDVSEGAVLHMKNQGLIAEKKTIFELENVQFDTILILMNGIGLAGTMENLPRFLIRLKKLLKAGGQILCDSTDLSYLYADEDGSFLINLNEKYYGEMQFNMVYKNSETGWFPWLYIDADNLSDQATKAGLVCQVIFEGENNHYLVSMRHA